MEIKGKFELQITETEAGAMMSLTSFAEVLDGEQTLAPANSRRSGMVMR